MLFNNVFFVCVCSSVRSLVYGPLCLKQINERMNSIAIQTDLFHSTCPATQEDIVSARCPARTSSDRVCRYVVCSSGCNRRRSNLRHRRHETRTPAECLRPKCCSEASSSLYLASCPWKSRDQPPTGAGCLHALVVKLINYLEC